MHLIPLPQELKAGASIELDCIVTTLQTANLVITLETRGNDVPLEITFSQGLLNDGYINLNSKKDGQAGTLLSSLDK